MKKAFGFPLTPDQDNCFGVCVTENWDYLGCWTSSNYGYLAADLQNHAKGFDYKFIPETPDKDKLIIALINKLNFG